MAILLGVDTGGTYTDAVLMEDNKNIIDKVLNIILIIVS